MPDWDADSAVLHANLVRLLEQISLSAARREKPAVESARQWHRDIMSGLTLPDPRYLGAFRGEAGLERIQVRVRSRYGVAAAKVSIELRRFEGRLERLVAELDQAIPIGHEPDADQLAAVIDLCAWVHSEWVRIHPFANGNGRTARLWANSLAMRYGLPPFLTLRPRPDGGYGAAGAQAMLGNWRATVAVFRGLLSDFLSNFL